MDSINTWSGLPVEGSVRMTEDRDKMEKVHPWCGQPSDRGRLKNRTACIRSILISSHVVHSSLLRYFTTGRGAEYYNIAVSMFVCRSVCLVSDLKSTVRYDRRSNFNEQSEADTSQLNLPHGTKLKKSGKEKSKKRICSEVSVNCSGNPWSQSGRRNRVATLPSFFVYATRGCCSIVFLQH